MYFLIEDCGLLQKYNIIQNKVGADIRREFDSKLVHNKEFSKTKIKSHGNKVTGFYDKNIPKIDSNHTFLAVLSLDSALKKYDSYYLQVFVKECKYTEKKVIRHINNNLSDFSYTFDESDEEKMVFLINTYY